MCTSERASQLGYIETKCAPQSDSHVGFLKSVLSGYFAIVVQEIIAKKFHELLITLFRTAHYTLPNCSYTSSTTGQTCAFLICNNESTFLETERPQHLHPLMFET